MRRRATLLALLGACAPRSASELPSPPEGARSVAMIGVGAGSGVLAPLPLEAALTSAPSAAELHFFAISLEAPTAVERAPRCAPAALPAPLASLRSEGDRWLPLDEPSPLVAPALGCVSTTTVAVAAAPGVLPCVLSELTRHGCTVALDLEDCAANGVSEWALRVDGSVCGPVAADPVCAAGTPPSCGGEEFLGLTLRDAPIVVRSHDVLRELERPELKLRDVLVVGDRIYVVALEAGSYVACEHRAPDQERPPSVIAEYRREPWTLTATRAGAPCLGTLAPADDGGFWGSAWPDEWPERVAVHHFSPTLTLTASASFAMPSSLFGPDLTLQQVYGFVDTHRTRPELTLIVLAKARMGLVEHTMAFLSFSPEDLSLHGAVELEGSPRAALRQDDLMVVSDDGKNGVRFFELPLEDPPRERTPLTSGNQLDLKLGPILLAPDVRRYLVGLHGDRGGLWIFTSRNEPPATRALFLRRPMGRFDGLLRMDATHALALLASDTPSSPIPLGPLYAAVIDFTIDPPSSIRFGEQSRRIGTGPADRTMVDERGVAWVLAPLDGAVLEIELEAQ